MNRLLAKKARGAVFFTSSPAWMLPSPTAAMYAGTKAFVTHFGVSLAAELKSDGIDVCVAHPSPVRSNFYDHAGDGAEVASWVCSPQHTTSTTNETTAGTEWGGRRRGSTSSRAKPHRSPVSSSDERRSIESHRCSDWPSFAPT